MFGVAALLAAVTIMAAMGVDRERPPLATAEELSYLPKGPYLKVAVLGYDQLVADMIWLKAVQLLGIREQTTQGFRWAYHAVDVLTDLDPQFAVAYQITGSILAVWANLIPESVSILHKGYAENPEFWQLPYFLGYNYYYELHDPVEGANYLRQASVLPGAPEFLPKLAARMTVEAGDPMAAMEFLERLYQQAEDERIKEGLLRRMKEVTIERDIVFLEEGIRLYQSRYGTRPSRLEDLVAGGVIATVPEEPMGGRYELNQADGTVTSTSTGRRLRVYRHQ